MPINLMIGFGPGTLRRGGAFDPASPFSRLAKGLWVDFSDPDALYTDAGTTPVAADGDLIYYIRDKSGKGYHYQQATSASRAVFKDAIFNGLSIARFDGANDFYSGVLATLTRNVGRLSLFYVVKHASTSNRYVAHFSSGSNAGQGRATAYVFDQRTRAVVRRLDGSSPVTAVGEADALNNLTVVEIDFNYTTGWISIYENGELSGLDRISIGTTSDTDELATRLGSGNNAVYLQADLCEVIAYVDATLDQETERAPLYRYFERWGVAADQVDTFNPAGPPPLVWTWFNDPRVLTLGADHYAVGGVGPGGGIMAAEIDAGVASLGVISASLEDDDHDNPAFLRRSDGKLLAFFAKHNSASLWVAVSTNVDDPVSWGTPIDLDSQLGQGNYAYANVIQIDSGRTYLFYRATNVAPGTGDWAWHYSYTDDASGTTGWTTGVQISGSARPYHRFRKNGTDRIDIIVNDGHPNVTPTNGTYHFYLLDTAGTITFHESDGTAISSPPFDNTDWTEVYNATTGGARSWVWDVTVDGSGRPVVCFATFPATGTNADHRYYQARWSGTAWSYHQICAAGGELYPENISAEQEYSGGVITDPGNPDTVYCSRQVDANGDIDPVDGVHQIFRYTSEDGGETWAGEQLTSGNEACFRPYLPEGGAKLFYVTGRYTSYTDFNTRIETIDI